MGVSFGSDFTDTRVGVDRATGLDEPHAAGCFGAKLESCQLPTLLLSRGFVSSSASSSTEPTRAGAGLPCGRCEGKGAATRCPSGLVGVAA